MKMNTDNIATIEQDMEFLEETFSKLKGDIQKYEKEKLNDNFDGIAYYEHILKKDFQFIIIGCAILSEHFIPQESKITS